MVCKYRQGDVGVVLCLLQYRDSNLVAVASLQFHLRLIQVHASIAVTELQNGSPRPISIICVRAESVTKAPCLCQNTIYVLHGMLILSQLGPRLSTSSLPQQFVRPACGMISPWLAWDFDSSDIRGYCLLKLAPHPLSSPI